MTSNANSVNMVSSRGGYHHGDLRAALVAEGLKHVEERSAATLSLREIARNVGVSAPAVYRHFPNKDALLRAVAGSGLDRLAAEQAEAEQRATDDKFAASGVAYVRFALANPGLFRLIFTSTPSPSSFARQPEGSAGRQLYKHAVAALGKEVDDARAQIVAYRAWSLVHGLAMLILDHQIDNAMVEPMIDEIVAGFRP